MPPLRPEDLPHRPELRARVRSILETWDGRDIWSSNQAALERPVLALPYEVSAPKVPAVNTGEQAARFLRTILERSRA